MSITLGTSRQADPRGSLAIQSRLKPSWPLASKKDPVPKIKEKGNPEKTTYTDLGLPKQDAYICNTNSNNNKNDNNAMQVTIVNEMMH